MKHKSNARDWQTRLRLWAALVMATFTIVNMGFYTLGIFSPEAMESYAEFWAPLFTLYPLFFLAVIAHISLGLWKIYRRNTLIMPFWEAVQIGFGLVLPFLFIPHLVVTSGLTYLFNFQRKYVDLVLLTFPQVAWRYVGVALIIGVHAHIGAHAVLRMRPWYPKVRVAIFVVLLLLPLSAATGYLMGGSTLYQAYTAGKMDSDDLPHVFSPDQERFVQAVDPTVAVFFLTVYTFLFAARFWRVRVQGRRRSIRVNYPGGGSISVFPGTTILEASRLGRIAHASICGGRGRCTTCRVKVESGMENLSPLGEREEKALKRIGAAEDVRLACQAELLKDAVKITPLLPPSVRSNTARHENRDTIGRDVEIAVMFADIRGFTKLSESRFPYDVVYILNSYFQDMGAAIAANYGHIDKFLGDGILAYFGLEDDHRNGCRNAILSAYTMAKNMERVNEQLKTVIEEPLSIGIGLHFGNVILGEMGYGKNRQLTIIGDTVNTASRLQDLNKAAHSQMIVSTAAAAQSGLDLSYLPLVNAVIRGKVEKLRVYIVGDILIDLKAVQKKEALSEFDK